MVFAVGSHLVRPPIPGFAEHAFDVDTHEAALRLNDHVAELPFRSATKAQYNVVVIGGGLTGIEVATEMVGKLNTAKEHGPSAGQKPAPA